MRGELMVSRRLPRVPMGRRAGAFAIDIGAVSLLSFLLAGSLFAPVFLLIWLGLRVFWVSRNHGQSWGQWALDIKVVSTRFGSLPTVADLMKREVVTGLGSLLTLIGVVSLSPTNGWILILPIPLLVDCGAAFLDTENRQALHDRLAGTVITQSRRGYSLDLKVRKLFAEMKQRMK